MTPTPRASSPNRFRASTAPKASQHAAPAFSSADIAHIVAIAPTRDDPRGHAVESVLRSLGVFRSGTGLSAPTSSTKTPTMPAASREKAAVTPTTDAKEEVPWMSSPPNRGPTMKAKVAAASRHASHRGSWSPVAASARYAFATGEAPPHAPLSARRDKNVQSGAFRARAADCAASPRPTPPRLRTRIGLRMPRLSDKRGQTANPASMPKG